MRILLTEDEKKVASFSRKAFREAGYAVDEVPDGTTALEFPRSPPHDAIVPDAIMPGRDGLGVLKLLRAQRFETPVLVLTARGAETQIVRRVSPHTARQVG